jgi:hypothetical protein
MEWIRARALEALPIIAAVALSTSGGCSGGKGDDPTDAGLDGGVVDGGVDGGPTDQALVFDVDPFETPAPVEVELSSVADDLGGVLTSAADADGVRRLAAFTCVDEGATNTAPFYGEQRICTLRQLANKEENGSFIYQDYADDAACAFDPTNVHAEVNAFYHTQRIYDLVTAPEVGVFDLLPGRHFVGGDPVPLTVVVNYRAPAPAGAEALLPMEGAFFLSREHLEMGMAAFQGLLGVPGDVLVFGQGEAADFAYAAETIYHEFGHATVNATAALGSVFADSWGLTNQPWALDEGIANTFAFLGSNEPLLGEFLSDCAGGGYTFDAENGAVFPADETGHPVVDGNPILAANHAVYREMIDAWGGTKPEFARVLLLALQDLAALDGDVAFADYSEAFLARLVSEGFASREPEARTLFEARGLLETARLVDATGYAAADGRYLVMRCAAQEPWNTVMSADLGDGPVPLATAFVQHEVTVQVGADQVVISARLENLSWAMTEPGAWDYSLLLRAAGPIEYVFGDGGVATANHDTVLEPIITPGEGGDPDLAVWTVDGLFSGETVHFQFVNLGLSEGRLTALDVK